MTALTVASVNVDSLDPERLAAFWAAATGGSITGKHEDFVFVSPPEEGGVMLFFQRVDRKEPGRNTLHLDFGVPEGERESEVRRLEGLGAERQWEVVGEVPWVDWTTMTDPEGNLFCVGSKPEGK
ncbi:VOC family protein [Pseudonocardia xishanensis]